MCRRAFYLVVWLGLLDKFVNASAMPCGDYLGIAMNFDSELSATFCINFT